MVCEAAYGKCAGLPDRVQSIDGTGNNANVSAKARSQVVPPLEDSKGDMMVDPHMSASMPT
jgi:hypothetical protein